MRWQRLKIQICGGFQTNLTARKTRNQLFGRNRKQPHGGVSWPAGVPIAWPRPQSSRLGDLAKQVTDDQGNQRGGERLLLHEIRQLIGLIFC
jgi:hypothetical protein